jgi:hypothetical protein
MNSNDPTSGAPQSAPGQPDDFKAMMFGGLVVFVLSLIPYVSLSSICCLPQIAGALVAIHLFTSRYRLTVSAGQGIKLGILAVLFGSLAAWAVAIAMQLLFNYQLNLKETEAIMLKAYSRLGPDVVEKVKEAFEKQRAEGLTLGKMFIGLCTVLIASGIGGLIGGALGTALFKRGPRQEQVR